MKCTVLVVVMLAVLVAPAFANVSISNADCSALAYCTTNLDGNCIPLTAGENYTLTTDITSCTLYFSGNQNLSVFTRINLNGYTVHPAAQDALMSRPEFVNVEIYGGTMTTDFYVPSYAETSGCMDIAVVGGQGTWGNIYIHDMTFNCDEDVLRSTRSQNFYGNKGLILERVVFNATRNLIMLSDKTIAPFTIKDSTVSCPNGCNLIGTYEVSGIFNLENVIIKSGTGNFWTSGNIPDEASVVSIKNVTKLDLDTAMETAGSAQYFVYQPATITAKDQNGANIDANAELVNLNGNSVDFGINYNPTQNMKIALRNGVGVAFVLTNSSFSGQRVLNLPTYNVTVRSRNQAQNKLVVFHSPAEASFTLDFSNGNKNQAEGSVLMILMKALQPIFSMLRGG